MSMRKKSSIIHRKPNFHFSENIEKHWLGSSPFKTHFLNSLTIIFPSGEKYFIRSVRSCLKRITNEETKTDALNFIKQEAQHALEHQRFFTVLRKQGYNPDLLFKIVDTIVSKILEPINSNDFNMALTAGLEHLTALISEISLDNDFLADAPVQLRALYDWHAAEEIEHRSVAFDIFQEISGNYPARILALIYGNMILAALTTGITSYLLIKDGEFLKNKTFRDAFDLFFVKEKLFYRSSKIFLRYLNPQFHPGDEDIDDLAHNIFNLHQWTTA